MNTFIVSPFWQSMDEQWVGSMLVALTVMILVSSAISLVRSKSVNMFLLTIGFIILASVLFAPKADSQSPKMFQLWLMSPAVLNGLSIIQIIMTTITVFGSIRQEFCESRKGKILHEIRSWIIAVVNVLPSPVLLVFIFWVEQNIMISTRQTTPTNIGFQVGIIVTIILLMIAFLVSWFKKYQLIALHFFIGFFLVCSGALLPCMTTKLSMNAITNNPYSPDLPILLAVLTAMIAIFLAGFVQNRIKHKLNTTKNKINLTTPITS
ncbi:MAG: hypothetical protein LBT09_15625 [Planctomycetaceae bacterium]|jgi:hypothetical protein|nr:hypothetical protein [Planctomycetaceae bacterium]